MMRHCWQRQPELSFFRHCHALPASAQPTANTSSLVNHLAGHSWCCKFSLERLYWWISTAVLHFGARCLLALLPGLTSAIVAGCLPKC